jgi:hypothetical protein
MQGMSVAQGAGGEGRPLSRRRWAEAQSGDQCWAVELVNCKLWWTLSTECGSSSLGRTRGGWEGGGDRRPERSALSAPRCRLSAATQLSASSSQTIQPPALPLAYTEDTQALSLSTAPRCRCLS